ncbi:MAG TPA: hypothetical protein ENN30_02245 [Candidatus Woesearchaeota archaeon]|nr:hypothetical protein [Candidatus Woesearchaeota archaeon]
MKKAQGLPIYAIIIILIAIIALVVVLLYSLGVVGQGEAGLGSYFDLTNRTVSNASESLSSYGGA